MKWRLSAATVTALLTLVLVGCSTNVYVKSYPIEQAEGTYTRIRIGVPTTGAASGVGLQINNAGTVAKQAIIDGNNILAIVQNEVIRSLQGAGHKVVLVNTGADLDLQISFEAPAAYCDLKCWLTLTALPVYRAVGGAKLVDARTGNVLATYELNTEIRTRRATPPNKIQDWEKFAVKLAEEIRKDLEKLQLAQADSATRTAYLGE